MHIKAIDIFIFLLILGSTSVMFGQSTNTYIYGKVYTCGNENYEGFIRWGDEEMYWHDVFNANKVDRPKLFNLDKVEEKTKWLDFNWDFSSIWDNKYNVSSHIFACFFGDIQYLDIGVGSRVSLGLKNGQVIELNGGSNDIGTRLRIEDYELGTVKVQWNKISKIEFYTAPVNAEIPYANPLYGIVKTQRKGTIEGYIKWDNDEREGNDILDCESKSGSKEIPFRNIKKIVKSGNGCDLTFLSGREIYVYGSNDVNKGNRGVVVYADGVGSVEIDWTEFKNILFVDPPEQGVAYDDFTSPEGIYSTISTIHDQDIGGHIIFDLDEMWEPEMLDGEDGAVKYQIPFANIARIEPKNENYALIYLKNGKTLLLGNTQDVSDANDGIMILNTDNKKPIVVPWDEIIYMEID